MKKVFALLAAVIFTVNSFAQTVLKSDPMHSRIQFVVKHIGISEITGNFDAATLTINADDSNFVNSKFNFTADINSINTHVEARDNHLKSADFFDAAKFNTMTFVSKSISKIKKDSYKVNGTLTMHGVAKPVTVTLAYKGATINPMNQKKTYAYQVTTHLKRSDFGVGPKFPEAVISNVVNVKGDFELTAE